MFAALNSLRNEPNCDMRITDTSEERYCSVDKTVDTLVETQKRLNVPMTKIMGFNEAWQKE